MQFLAYCCETGCYDRAYYILQQLFGYNFSISDDKYEEKNFSKSYRPFPKNIHFSKNGCFLGTPLRGPMGDMVDLRFVLGSLGTQGLNTF